MRITDYVGMFPHYKQERIRDLLIARGVSGHDLEDAMCSRLSDLDEHVSLDEMRELINEN